jgi:hypothetical protein
MPILYVIIFIPQKSVKNLFLVRQRGFKLAFPDGEGEPLAVDRVDYRQPKAGCAVFHRTKFGLRVLTLLRRRRPATQEQAPILIFWYFLNFL